MTDAVVSHARTALRAHRVRDDRKALRQIAGTLLALMACYALALRFVDVWPVWVLAVAGAAAFKVRLFNLEHDAGHGSLFRSPLVNRFVGAALGVLTFTPQGAWFLHHLYHHASNGDLDRRGRGDVKTWTRREFRAASAWRRFGYRILRHPLFLFGVAPILQFGLVQRFAFQFPREWRHARWSVYGTNLAIACWLGASSAAFGATNFLLTELAVMWLAGGVGVWLFYVQHQLPRSYWARGAAWRRVLADTRGSSFYDLPRWLHWLTANIGYHHLHHLNPGVPNYALPLVHREVPELAAAVRITLRESLACAWLALWDEDAGRMITFNEHTQEERHAE